jgi:hypothetical protein
MSVRQPAQCDLRDMPSGLKPKQRRSATKHCSSIALFLTNHDRGDTTHHGLHDLTGGRPGRQPPSRPPAHPNMIPFALRFSRPTFCGMAPPRHLRRRPAHGQNGLATGRCRKPLSVAIGAGKRPHGLARPCGRAVYLHRAVAGDGVGGGRAPGYWRCSARTIPSKALCMPDSRDSSCLSFFSCSFNNSPRL